MSPHSNTTKAPFQIFVNARLGMPQKSKTLHRATLSKRKTINKNNKGWYANFVINKMWPKSLS